MKYINYLLFLIVASSTFSCETIVDEIDLSQFPELREKIVVNSFIKPGTDSIIVRVSRSLPIFSESKIEFISVFDEQIQDSVFIVKDSQIIENAIVSLSDGETTVLLKYVPEHRFYSVQNFEIKAGKTYGLVVETAAGKVEASTTVPLQATTIENFTIEKYFEVSNTFFGKDTAQGFTVNFDWKDIPNQNNYYRVWGELKYMSEIPSGTRDSLVYKLNTSYGYLDLNNDFTGDSRYFTDAAKDGQYFKILNAKLLFRDYFTCFGNNFERDCFRHRIVANSAQNFTIEVANISKELYDYQQSLRSFNRTEENPFAEPTPVFSNIKNGLGIFAAYHPTIIKQDLR